MIIDKWGIHKHLKADQLDAAMLAQAITWIEESHYWRTISKDSHSIVKCQWCGADRKDYYAPLKNLPLEEMAMCPENPILKGFSGDPNVYYTLHRIKA